MHGKLRVSRGPHGSRLCCHVYSVIICLYRAAGMLCLTCLIYTCCLSVMQKSYTFVHLGKKLSFGEAGGRWSVSRSLVDHFHIGAVRPCRTGRGGEFTAASLLCSLRLWGKLVAYDITWNISAFSIGHSVKNPKQEQGEATPEGDERHMEVFTTGSGWRRLKVC